MYFPTLEQLLLDATLGAMSSTSIDAVLERNAHDHDPKARVHALANAMVKMSSKTLTMGRRLIRLTVETPEKPRSNTPRRGYRRVHWIERALEPLRRRVSAERLERLISALTVLMGWEAMIVLRDVRGLDLATETQVTTWATGALVDAIVAEEEKRPTSRRRKRT
jgi:hypothetical protein